MSDDLSHPPTSAGEFGEVFVQLLTAEQMRLLSYIAVLLGDPHAAHNVLQETNLVLWRKARDFSPGTSFTAWSRKVAYWQVQAYVRDRRRDRHVFSEELMAQIASNRESADAEVDDTEARVALRHCLESVSKSNLSLLRQRYEDGLSIANLAIEIGKTQSAVKAGLMRIRRALLRCIEKELGSSQAS